MNHYMNPRSRKAWRYGTFAVLLSLTLGSTAQTSLRWNTQPSAPSHATAPQPATSRMSVAAPVAAAVIPARATTPLATGFDVRDFEGMAQQLVADQRVPGLAMAIVHNGRIVSARGYGITDTRAAQPVDAHTVFRLASLSKAFAGTMTGLLVNDGVLRWDSRLTDYLPDVPPAATRTRTRSSPWPTCSAIASA